MRELLIDFITSLDGYASADGWPGWWGLEGPEYLAWLGEQPPVTYLMGANTYRLMSGFAGGETPAGTAEFHDELIDVVSETGFADPGRRVRVLSVSRYRVAVEVIDDNAERGA